jgi:outer membrane receptor protein involved in Fe transport
MNGAYARRKPIAAIAIMINTSLSYAATEERLAPVDIISTTPLHGAGIERDKVPGNVKTATDSEIDRQQSLDLSEFLNQRFSSVFINQAQNNPLQPDVQYRGFVASPLLGLPQGLSVYMDGVRINEPFGDTVNWALIPESAIADINLISGSNPLFGLNTLGGALSVHTKNGLTHPGTRGEVLGGSFGRKSAQLETGGARNRLNYFLTGAWFDEDGWRDHSPSETKQLFGNLGWNGADSTLEASISLADTNLIGNGPVPVQLQEQDREAVFTYPDITENELLQLRLGGTHALNDTTLLESAIYYRQSDIDTLNGDDSDFAACMDAGNAGLLCEFEDGSEEVVEDENGNDVAADSTLEGAVVNRSRTRQYTTGFTLQSVFLNDLAGRENQFIVGVSDDVGKVSFRSSSELGSLDASRKAIGGGVFVGEAFTRVDTESRNLGVYFTDTYSITEKTAVTLSGRYNWTDIELKDRLGTALNGRHEYSRFNPAVGVTHSVSKAVNLFAGYNESSRAPTALELTCADPDDPCRLPNAFLSDPPLKQVVARTVEIGFRGGNRHTRWDASVFRTVNEDDILFVSSGALTNQGFFDNVGDTRRQGLELGLQGRTMNNRLDWFASYTWLDASFQDNLTLPSENNPFAVNGEINVKSGDRLPGLPEHQFKAGATFSPTARLSIGADVNYVSDIVLRGDEGNLDDPIDGYTLLDLRGEYAATEHLTFFLKIKNVFDKDYETFGLYGDAEGVLGSSYDNPRFLSPGAPRAAWAGLKFQF